ncbi:hypothetical protein NQ318_009107 [Aromia moschata]|uniref:Uncharacterized protein n=1 Tax=Aromia moschata TaxID=1265417 RepID=A0AAV8XNQ9_9CUCU|nr:hypothetical protein NQ318_009107 [Aromia moschata]
MSVLLEQIPENVQKKIINDFNMLESYDEQNAYLAGLISVITVQRRRPRKAENEVVHFKQSSYKFRVRCVNEIGEAQDIQVCYKAFLSLHGITARRLQTIQNCLKASSSASKDGRGKHKNRPIKLSEETIAAAVEHISAFKGRSSHHSLNKTTKIYLPEELNITKMFRMFQRKNILT